MTINVPPKDLDLAQRLGVPFQVAVKAAPGTPWEDVGTPTSLREVIPLAQSLISHEIGIFMNNTDGSGRIYWSSLTPNLFNSTLFDLRH